MPMLKTPIAILIMLLFFDSIRNSYMYLAWFEAACLAGISQKTGIECSYGTHARSHARWGGDTIPPTRPTLLDRHVKVQKYSDTVL